MHQNIWAIRASLALARRCRRVIIWFRPDQSQSEEWLCRPFGALLTVCGWWAPLILFGLVIALGYAVETKLRRYVALPVILFFCAALVVMALLESGLCSS